MSEPLLRAENIARSFGRHEVLRGVNLTVAPGALVGIVGENGAGKSTLVAYPRRASYAPIMARITRTGALGYCPQEVVLNETLTVNQHLDYFGAAYGIHNIAARDELIDRPGLPTVSETPRGNAVWRHEAKVNLTLALMHDPRVCCWTSRIRDSTGRPICASGIWRRSCARAAAGC